MIAALKKKDASSNKKANKKESRTKSEFCWHEAGLAMGKRVAVLECHNTVACATKAQTITATSIQPCSQVSCFLSVYECSVALSASSGLPNGY